MPTANPGPLTLVNNDLVAITTLVGSAMNLATQSLLDADLSLAEKVIQADANIDALCSAVEDRCLELLEDKRSTGSELRSIIGALRIAASLERMGDLAEHVAKQARMRYPNAAVPQDLRATFAIMGGVAEAIVSKSGAVIATKDVSLA
ncbi:MAG: phosphate transport system regulatory protein PhoU, partial [Actinobacteria bacterium]|nr:phosphate transport system regulatory protein PhoU [Actinomycetota bacterium]